MSNSPSLSDSALFDNLVPRQYRLSDGRPLLYFVSSNLPLVKLDFTFEAGSIYQDKKCQSAAASQLVCQAGARHTAAEVAEFFDFRGIIVERGADVCTGSVTVYFLRPYAEELFMLLRELFDDPVVTEQAFAAHVAKRRMQLLSGQQKTSVRARNAFYEAVCGPAHPLGRHAQPADADSLSIDDVRRFIRDRYSLSQASLMLGGDIDEELLRLADRYFSSPLSVAVPPALALPASEPLALGPEGLEMIEMPQAVQSTIRMGRVLPFAWDSEECALFSVLNTVLGGYFGSRLMTNLREDKGYTYGIYSQMQVYRGAIVFFLTADVAAESTSAALYEICAELERLCAEPVAPAELQRVCSYMRGDFLRSIDGIFEISERCRQMTATGCDERITRRLLETLRIVTPQHLCSLAQQMFAPGSLVTIVAGPAHL